MEETVVAHWRDRHQYPEERWLYIGRKTPRAGIFQDSDWMNPFHIGKDGTREEVIAKHAHYLQWNEALMARLPELKGMCLLCWCKEKPTSRYQGTPCHGDTLMLYCYEATGR